MTPLRSPSPSRRAFGLLAGAALALTSFTRPQAAPADAAAKGAPETHRPQLAEIVRDLHARHPTSWSLLRLSSLHSREPIDDRSDAPSAVAALHP